MNKYDNLLKNTKFNQNVQKQNMENLQNYII